MIPMNLFFKARWIRNMGLDRVGVGKNFIIGTNQSSFLQTKQQIDFKGLWSWRSEDFEVAPNVFSDEPR